MISKILVFFSLLILSFQTTLSASSEPQTVDYVDLGRYVGKWYEISAMPMFFEWFCDCSTAEYSANADNTIKVNNTCKRLGRFNSIHFKFFYIFIIFN